MQKRPLISIISPAFNSERFIEETIQSVLKQSYNNWELIIIDDASSDKTLEIIDKLAKKEKRIKPISLAQNGGAGIARNTGVKLAKGQYITFLDADDLWKPHKLETQLKFMQEKNNAICFSSYELINEEGKPLPYYIEALPKLTLSKLLKANYIGNLTGMYKVSELGKIKFSTLRKRQDWAMWLMAIKKAEYAFGIKESLAYYRVRENSISSNKIKMLSYNYKVYKQFLGFSTLKSVFYMSVFLKEQFFVKNKQKKLLN